MDEEEINFIKNSKALKKLGLDNCEWVLYQGNMSKFFSFLAKNITDANILTEDERLEFDLMSDKEETLSAAECVTQMEELQREYPGLMHYTEEDISELEEEIEILAQQKEMYSSLLDEMCTTSNNLNAQLDALNGELQSLSNREKKLLSSCCEKSQQLEKLQSENLNLGDQATDCFLKIYSPNLFMHQMAMDDYYSDCNSVHRYFTMYLAQNFKIEGFSVDMDTSEQKFIQEVNTLGTTVEFYTFVGFKAKGMEEGTQKAIEALDISKVDFLSLEDVKQKTRELAEVNKSQLKAMGDSLLKDLKIHAKMLGQQHVELILYENTKNKIERAQKRQEKQEILSKLVSNALDNADLMWIFIQLDIGRASKYIDYREQLAMETYSSLGRIKSMQQMLAMRPYDRDCAVFLKRMSQYLSKYLGNCVRPLAKSCLYEYDKFSQLLHCEFQRIFNKKQPCRTAFETLQSLSDMMTLLKPWMEDSPMESPFLVNMKFEGMIFDLKRNQQALEKAVRELRVNFQKNIRERMVNDTFWRYSQLLWIWFLTEPRRVIHAIEEVKKAASRASQSTSKTLSGIKRK